MTNRLNMTHPTGSTGSFLPSEVAAMRSAGWVDADVTDDVPLAKRSVADLRELAESLGIDQAGLKKSDLIVAIEAHEAETAN